MGVLVHQLRGDRRRRTLREVCARATKSPVAQFAEDSGGLLVLPSAAARVWVGVRTELRDEGEEEHDTVAVRRQPRLHRMACAQPTPTDQIHRLLTRFEIDRLSNRSRESRAVDMCGKLTHAERHDDTVPSFGRDLHEAELLALLGVTGLRRVAGSSSIEHCQQKTSARF